jgi:hypothetical protein
MASAEREHKLENWELCLQWDLGTKPLVGVSGGSHEADESSALQALILP